MTTPNETPQERGRDVAADPPSTWGQSVAPADHVLFAIGDIGVSQHWVVTPNGSAPLRGSRWIVQDLSRSENKIPTWAIVLAIIFAVVCLLGLFFLLVKENVTTGYVQVQVQSADLLHVTQIPVQSPLQVAQVRQQVSQAQSLAAALA